MTQDHPIKRLLIAHRGEDNRGADQHVRPLRTIICEAKK
jgi:hypothetical protein